MKDSELRKLTKVAKIAKKLYVSVGRLWLHVSGMMLCWPFNPHCGELSYVLCSYRWCGL